MNAPFFFDVLICYINEGIFVNKFNYFSFILYNILASYIYIPGTKSPAPHRFRLNFPMPPHTKRAASQKLWLGFSHLRFISRGRQAENLASRAFLRRWRQATIKKTRQANAVPLSLPTFLSSHLTARNFRFFRSLLNGKRFPLSWAVKNRTVHSLSMRVTPAHSA